jgi:hypothetical protein
LRGGASAIVDQHIDLLEHRGSGSVAIGVEMCGTSASHVWSSRAIAALSR